MMTHSREVLLDILKRGGVEPEQTEDGRYRFVYKNEHLMAEVSETGNLMCIFDYTWYGVSRWDVEKVTHLQQVISLCNTSSRAKSVYVFDDEDDEMNVTTILVTPLMGGIPNVDGYFAAQLDSILDVHRIILKEMGEPYEEEEEEKKDSSEDSPGTDDNVEQMEVKTSMEMKGEIVRALESLNCQWEESAPEVIRFEDQAESFILQLSEDTCYATLIDPSWYSFSIDDIEQLSMMKDVINDLNWYFSTTASYSRYDKQKEFHIHTYLQLLVLDSIDLRTYFIETMREFFLTHHRFYKMMAERMVDNKEK